MWGLHRWTLLLLPLQRWSWLQLLPALLGQAACSSGVREQQQEDMLSAQRAVGTDGRTNAAVNHRATHASRPVSCK